LWQAHSQQLRRCTVSLARKPASVWENPATLAQMCKFLRQVCGTEISLRLRLILLF
jgi:hypothetical protein